MRDREVIERAHDVLVGYLREKETLPPLDPATMEAICAALNALCWVLGDDHTKGTSIFSENVSRLGTFVAEGRAWALTEALAEAETTGVH